MSERFTYVVKRLVTFSVMGVIAVGGLYLFAGPEVFLSVLERFRESQLLQLEFDVEESGGDFGRAIMLLEAYNIVTTDPLTGIGYNTFKPYIESRYSFGVISHNILLSIWGEMGIFGFVTFVGMVSTAFRLAGKGQKGARSRGDTERWLFLGASKAALVLLLVHAMVRPQLTNPALWIVVAACLGVGWANRDHRSMPRTANSVSSVAS
jgi:O-antigen ligase